MTLKPKPEIFVALIGLGLLLAIIGMIVRDVGDGLLGLVIAVPITTLGVLLTFAGLLSLTMRRKQAIIIDDTGIEIPAFSVFQMRSDRVLLDRNEIAKIEKQESIKGRCILISLRERGPVVVQARHYCELNDFIAHCERHNLPVVR